MGVNLECQAVGWANVRLQVARRLEQLVGTAAHEACAHMRGHARARQHTQSRSACAHALALEKKILARTKSSDGRRFVASVIPKVAFLLHPRHRALAREHAMAPPATLRYNVRAICEFGMIV